MPQESTGGQSIVAADAQATYRDTSDVPNWEPGLKSVRMMGYSLSGGRRHTRALMPTRPCSVNRELILPAWHKPYAEALLTKEPQALVRLLAAAEIAFFERILELGDENASDERDDISRAIDVVLDLKAKTQANLKMTGDTIQSLS